MFAGFFTLRKDASEELGSLLSLASIYSKLHDCDTKNKAIRRLIEQSSFGLMALFGLKIDRCRRNWLNGNQAIETQWDSVPERIKTYIFCKV